jgi:transposase
VDIILGKERRRWSLEDKLAIVAETLAPGAVALEIARRHQISSGQLHTWRKQYRAELGFPSLAAGLPAPTAPMRFMPVAIAAETAAPTIEVELSGARVKITGGIEASMVMALIKALMTKSR